MSFLVELRQWILKRAIALELGEKGVVRDDRLFSALGDYREIVQIFEKLLIVAEGKDDSSSVTVLVREVLQGLAHGMGGYALASRKSRTRAVTSDGYPA